MVRGQQQRRVRTTNITVTMTASDEPVGAYVQEFSGVATTSPLDTSNTNSGTGTTVTSPSLTTGTAGDLVVAAGATTSPNTAAPATPWTDLAGPQLNSGYYDNPIVTQTGAAAGTYTTSWTQTTSGPWAAEALALKPAARAAITQNLTAGCTAFGYDNDGHRTTTQFPGGATETVSYLPSGLISTIGATTSNGTTVITSYSYRYTTAAASGKDTSLVQSRVENDPSTSNANVTITYSYDTMNRLTSAVASTGTSYYYSYDADGNRTCAQTTGTCTTTPYTYNNADELTTGPAGNYTYDPDGNELTSPQLTNLAYNTKNQTSAITPSGGSTQNYTYTGADSPNAPQPG